MTTSNCINSVGLVLDIVGATLLWRYGLPAEISRTGAQTLIEQQTNEAEVKEAARYDRVASWGFLSLVAGFVLQLVSNFVTT